MKTHNLFLVISILTTCIWSTDRSNQKNISATKLTSKITVDGKLAEGIWKSPAMKDFVQLDPTEGAPPSEETDVWIAYDDEALYIAARLLDSKAEQIDASLARRDSWIDSDWFFFYVDPYHDKTTGYFFAVNAGGSIIDGTYFNDSWNDDSWDGKWEAKTNIDQSGWFVEMKIPFSQLRFNEADELTWGVNFMRQIKRNNEKSYFVMVPKKESGFVSHFANLTGLINIKPKQRFELSPYLVQKAKYLDHDDSDPFYKGQQYKTTLGADIKVGVGSNLNLDITLNPDFGQVEVDPAVVNLSAFETYFPEKRPFFIEGQDIFLFGVGGSNNNWGFNFGWPTLFYSRRIGRSPQVGVDDYDYIDQANETRILGAAKLTGKIGKDWSIGAVSAVTERTFATYDYEGVRDSREIEPLTHYGVLKAKTEFNGGAEGLGLLFTTVNRDLQNDVIRENLSANAFAGGVDGWTFLDDDKKYVITAAFAGSYLHGSKEYLKSLQERAYRNFQRPDATYSVLDTNKTSMSGYFGRVMLNKQSGNFYINAALGAISPGFENNDLGFQWMSDRINGHLVLGYRWFEPDDIFRRKSVYVAHAESWDYEGNNTSNFVFADADFEFLNYYGVGVNSFVNFPTISNSFSRGGVLVRMPGAFNISLYGYTDSRESIILNASTNYWKDRYGGYGITYSTNLEWKPSSQLNLSVGPEYSINNEKAQFVDNIEDAHALQTLGIRSVFGEMEQKTIGANIRLNWTFSPELSLQLFLQPLFSVGKYTNLKELKAPRSLDFNYYNESGEVSYNAEDEEYTIDPDKEGDAESFSISNPDFNIKSLRGNLVLRWEVSPGSILYLVWSHEKSNSEDPGDFRFGRDLSYLWNAEPNNIFLVKFSYWFDF